MAQVTPTQLGLDEFTPQGQSERELQFLIAYYTKLLQTQGITGTEDVNLTKIVGQPVSVNNGASDGGTQRVTLASNSPGATALTDAELRATPVPVSGTVTNSNLPATADTNYGTPGASTLRTAAMVGIGATAASVSNPVPVAGTAADNAAATGNPNQIGGVAVVGSTYNPAYTAGDAAVLPIDTVSGGPLGHIRTLTVTDQITITPVANLVARQITATTTTHKSGSGTLVSLIVNKHVATGVITVYDNTAGSGTTLAIITTGAAVLTDAPIGAQYNIPFSTGLTIVTSQAEDITIVYR